MAGGQPGEGLVEPVIVAQVVRNPIVGLERERLRAAPQRGDENDDHDGEQTEADPLPSRQADVIGERDRVRLARRPVRPAAV